MYSYYQQYCRILSYTIIYIHFKHYTYIYIYIYIVGCMIQFWCWSSFFSVGSNVSQATRIRGACWNSLPAMMIKTLENWWKIVTYCGSPYTEFAWFFAILQASKGSWFHSPIAHKSFTLKRNHHGSGIWSWKMILLVEARNFHFHCCFNNLSIV